MGLIAAPSTAGLLIGLAALAAFVARTPLRVVLVDRLRKRKLPRTRLAEAIAVGELVVVCALLVAAWLVADAPFWQPLALALPLVAVELWFDARSRGRRLVPELAGTIGIGSVAAAIALAGGLSGGDAAGLWVIVAARVVAAIPFVRLQLRRAKGQAASPTASVAAQAAAVGVAIAGAAVGAAPLPGVVAIVCLAVGHLVLQRRPAPAVAVLGSQQVALGLGVAVAAALGVRAPS